MDFKLPPELEALKQTMRQIVNTECIPREAYYLAHPPQEGEEEVGGGLSEEAAGIGTLPPEDWDKLRKISLETGIYNAHIPVEYGGGGLGSLGHVVMDEEAHRSIILFPVSRAPMMMFGNTTKEQDEKYLIPCIRGEKSYAFGQTEPQAGSDPGGMMQTRAVRDGDDWIINGTKMFISGASTADFILLQAVTDPEKRQRGGITMFIIDRGTPGVSFAPIRVWITPTKARQFFVFLDNVRVPHTQVLGEVGNGFRLGQRWLVHHDRVLRGSMSLGIQVRALSMAVDWAKQRVTFGRPLADRQAIQWMLVDCYINIIGLRQITHWTAWRADQGEDVRVEASLVKYCAGEWGWQTIDKVMQVFGGLGETLDMPIPHWYHQLRHARVGGGTSEIHKFVMARAILSGAVSWDA
jgi:acyl-CoA dehydrogenase